jgi:hypothetical protein
MSLARSARGVFALLALIGLVAPGRAQASAQVVEYTRAVAYWYLPTAETDVYRLYHVEVVRLEDLSNGSVSASATVVTDKCRERQLADDQLALYCGKDRRERSTEAVELDVATDLSTGRAELQLAGRTYVVRFQAPQNRSMGVFERDRRCSATDQKLVPGAFSNMERAYGRLLGRHLGGPNPTGYDHAWLEKGAGTWC